MINIVHADSELLKSKAFDIRREVFVVEQQVDTAEEFDEFEEIARHFVALNEHEEPIGAARWRRTKNGIKLERFAVKKTYRGQGVGGVLVKSVLDDIQIREGKGQYLYLHAQLPAAPLYERYGFQKKGDTFLECDILHYLMHRSS